MIDLSDKSDDRNDYFTQSIGHVAEGLTLLWIVVLAIAQMTMWVASLPVNQ